MKQRSHFRVQFDLLSRKIFAYFLQGLLFAAPIGLTGFIVFKLFEFSDGILRSFIEGIINGIVYDHTPADPIRIPGLGLLIMVILITFVGYAGKTVVAQPFKAVIERVIKRVPVLQMVYTSIRDFMEAFVGKEKKFNQPVLVKINKENNLEKLGFITETDLTDLGLKDKVAVYFPHSYNFSGELFIVPGEQVTPLDVPPGVLMKFIVSGGVTRIES
ncbi:MAG TPA: DUF502 domain-containing protein [Bacteroidales bacterium]|jgi:uncharacterized membrane protein|nr:DUF502 domain-containing protein [Bacteroidales bacterium]